MSAELTALILGTLLAVGALAFVLSPLFFDAAEPKPSRRIAERPAEDSAIVALREIEFDQAMGKLSASDYAELKQSYTARALIELRAAAPSPTAVPPPAAQGAAPDPHDPIEARIRAVRTTHRECVTCGVRPETDAIYCSTCGAALPP